MGEGWPESLDSLRIPTMAKLKILHKDKVSEWPLGSFVLTIGRASHNNIVINERAVAPEHAEISFAQGRHLITDLGGKAGTRVNGVVVEQAILKEGDLIQIGSLALRFQTNATSTGETSIATTDAPPATAETAMLDELVDSIRSHRARELGSREQAIAQIQIEWESCLKLAEELRLKVVGDPRIKYFEINRRANDVMIRIQRQPGGPQRMITLALRHPDYPEHILNGIWLIRTDEPVRCLATSQEIANHLVRDLAFALA